MSGLASGSQWAAALESESELARASQSLWVTAWLSVSEPALRSEQDLE